MDSFCVIEDPRIERHRKHNLIDIIVIAVCGTLTGCQGWVEIADYAEENIEWFSQFLDLPHGIPSHDTFGRVFSLLNPKGFQEAFIEWLKSAKDIFSAQHISIDGKFLKGSLRESGRPRSAISLVSAWSTELGICLAQKKSILEKEEGEKRTMEALLNELFLKGCIVSIDANGATERITKCIVQGGADYIIGLKQNQAGMLKYAEMAVESLAKKSFETIEKGHGRIEKRVYELVEVNADILPGMMQCWEIYCQKFTKLAAFVRVTSTRMIGDVSSTEIKYYFTSLKDIQPAANSIRNHWGIENKLHRTLDVDFGEDHSQIRLGHAAENLGLIRRMAINMLKLDTETKRSIRRKQFRCLISQNYLAKVLGNSAGMSN